jgi:hypothetical protein
MNMFGNLAPTEGMEEAQDRIGGFKVFNAGAYTGKIKLAYAGKSSTSDARSVTIVLSTPEGDYTETLWVTNKTGTENFYVKDGKKYPLPGFTVINDICLVTTNVPLDKQPGEEKVINLYDYDAKKEVPTGVPMLVDLLGKEVTFGIQKHLENKAEKNAQTGIYEDTAETREKNVVDKVFHHPSKLTVVEAIKNIQTATFYGAWVEKNTDQVQDRRSIKDGAGASQGGRSGRPGGAAGAPPKSDGAKATTSLFGSAAG